MARSDVLADVRRFVELLLGPHAAPPPLRFSDRSRTLSSTTRSMDRALRSVSSTMPSYAAQALCEARTMRAVPPLGAIRL
jgi:hypothetical protein